MSAYYESKTESTRTQNYPAGVRRSEDAAAVQGGRADPAAVQAVAPSHVINRKPNELRGKSHDLGGRDERKSAGSSHSIGSRANGRASGGEEDGQRDKRRGDRRIQKRDHRRGDNQNAVGRPNVNDTTLRRSELVDSVNGLRLERASWFEIEKYWPEIKGHIETALSHGGICWNAEDIKDMLVKQAAQLWVVLKDKEIRAVCVTRIIQWPQTRTFNVLVLAGENMKDWFHFIEDGMDWARKMGCHAIDAGGRPGFKPWFKGWDREFVTYRKML